MAHADGIYYTPTVNSITVNSEWANATYNALTDNYVKQESKMDVIDALFELKPKLRKKYKGDREAFRKDLFAAADEHKGMRALERLEPLLDIEY